MLHNVDILRKTIDAKVASRNLALIALIALYSGIHDILLQFSRENFYFGCTFWTFYDWQVVSFIGRTKPQGKVR